MRSALSSKFAAFESATGCGRQAAEGLVFGHWATRLRSWPIAVSLNEILDIGVCHSPVSTDAIAGYLAADQSLRQPTFTPCHVGQYHRGDLRERVRLEMLFCILHGTHPCSGGAILARVRRERPRVVQAGSAGDSPPSRCRKVAGGSAMSDARYSLFAIGAPVTERRPGVRVRENGRVLAR
jgi:hypothetical protein